MMTRREISLWACHALLCVLTLLFGALVNTGTAEAAVIASGTLRVSDGTLVRVANQSFWDDALLTWSVDDAASEPGRLKYTYEFDAPGVDDPTVSHISIEASAGFSSNNIFNAMLNGVMSQPEGNQGQNDEASLSNVDMSGQKLFGLKWNINSTGFTLMFESNRIAVWGDLFLKGGQLDAHNAGYFDPDPVTPVTGTDITGFNWLAVPDSEIVVTPTPNPSPGPNPGPGPSGAVPEPATAALALVGFAGWLVRRPRGRSARPGNGL